MKYDEENNASRDRLRELARRISDEELARVTAYGWSAAALFAHLAWWDRRMTVLIQRWREQGIDESPVDLEMINESLKPLCHAIEPRTAVALCLACAEEADAELAAVSQELFEAIEASPNHFRFNRSLHRASHIGDIEALL